MRNSNIELLRIVCILMIITMHVFGEYRDINDPVFRHTCTFVNAFCNSAVTIFILISGFYGIKPSLEKWVSLFTITTFYGWIDFAVHQTLPPPIGGLEFKEMVKDIMPVFCNRYWFITSYLMLMALSGYIQRVIDSISRKDFLLLICILSIFVIIAPTIFLLEIFKDAGKGFMNMLTVYLIGRYFSKYGFPRLVTKWYKLLIPILTIMIFIFNEILGIIGLPGLFGRDNNIMNILLGVSVFYGALHLPVKHTSYINKIAKYTLPIYIVHCIFNDVVNSALRYYLYIPSLIQVAVAIYLLFVVSILIDELRQRMIGRVFEQVNKLIVKCLGIISSYI